MKVLECSQHYTLHFSTTQGQLTQYLVMGSGRNLISFMVLWLSLLPARMMKIHSKMEALDCSRVANLVDPSLILPKF